MRIFNRPISFMALLVLTNFSFIPEGQSQVFGDRSEMSPDRSFIARWTIGDSFIKFYSVNNLRYINPFDAGFAVGTITFSPSGQYWCISSVDEKRAIVVDSAGDRTIKISLSASADEGVACMLGSNSSIGLSFDEDNAKLRSSRLMLVRRSKQRGFCTNISSPKFLDAIFDYYDPIKKNQLILSTKTTTALC